MNCSIGIKSCHHPYTMSTAMLTGSTSVHRTNRVRLILLLLPLFNAILHCSARPQALVIQDETREIHNQQKTLLKEIMEEEEEEIYLNQSDCVETKINEGVYRLRTEGESTAVCGLYLIAKPEYFVELEFEEFDISCNKKGLLVMFDGWERQGQWMPGLEDHPLPQSQRFHEFCGSNKPKQVFRTSQNVGMIQYRVPNHGQGFRVRVRFVENPKPCNVVIYDMVGIYTLRNYGQAINCTATFIYPLAYQIVSMNIGQSYRPIESLFSARSNVLETGIIKKCIKRGYNDYVEFRGGQNWDSAMMKVKEDMCGVRSLSSKKKSYIGCNSVAARLVSSGAYDNLVEFVFMADVEGNPNVTDVC